MNILYALILSAVEGITEFLPISSTGHLVIVSHLLSISQSNFTKTFEIAIQSGAILSVVVLYWKRLLIDRQTLKRVLIAFVPTGILGLILYKIIKNLLLGNLTITLISLLVGGIAIILLEQYFKQKEGKKTINQMSIAQSILVGITQSLSMIPGVSRAAATIFGGMFVGLSRTEATEFSFLLAIPTMFAATGYDLLKSAGEFKTADFTTLGIGFVASFIVALLTVKWFIGFVKNHTLVSFGIYRVVISCLLLITI